MQTSRITVIAAALALSFGCLAAEPTATSDATPLEPLDARLILRNPEAFYATPATPDLRVLRVADPVTDNDRMSIRTDGTVTFAPGATVNFSGIQFQAGRFRGFVAVRVMGHVMLTPVFDPLPGQFGEEWQP